MGFCSLGLCSRPKSLIRKLMQPLQWFTLCGSWSTLLCFLTSEHMRWDKPYKSLKEVKAWCNISTSGWFTRTSWQLWTRPGTPTTSSVHTVEACLELTVRSLCIHFSSLEMTTWAEKLEIILCIITQDVYLVPVPGFLEKDGKPYCCKDFYNLFSPKCSGCGESVRANYLTAANGTWHPECFVCAVSLLPQTTHAALAYVQAWE